MRVGSVPMPGILRLQGTAARELSRAVATLASGLAVRTAAHGPAELAAAQRLRAEVLGARQARRNVQAGRELLDTAESGLAAAGDVLLRMRDMAVQSANPTLSEADRTALQTAWAGLMREFRSLVTSTAYNGMTLLDGTFTPRTRTVTRTETVVVAPEQPASVTVEAGTNRGHGGIVVAGTPLADASYTLTILSDAVFTDPSTSITPQPARGRIDVGPGSWPTTNTVYEVMIYQVKNDRFYRITEGGTQVMPDETITEGLVVGLPNGAVIQFVDKPAYYKDGTAYSVTTTAAVSQPAQYQISGPEGDQTGTVSQNPVDLGNGLTLSFDSPGQDLAYLTGDTFTITATAARPAVTAEQTVTETVTAGRPLVLQIGPAPGAQLRLTLPEVTPEALGIDQLALPSPDSADQALTLLDTATEHVHSGRAAIGALTNALQHVEQRMEVHELNLQQAVSHLVDADFALEASRLNGALTRVRLSGAAVRSYTAALRDSLSGLLVSVTDIQGRAPVPALRAWTA
ncbi:MAG: flagellin [Bacillota bacterium]